MDLSHDVVIASLSKSSQRPSVNEGFGQCQIICNITQQVGIDVLNRTMLKRSSMVTSDVTGTEKHKKKLGYTAPV